MPVTWLAKILKSSGWRLMSWSNRKKFTVGGALGSAASVATILTFLHPASPAVPAPGPAVTTPPVPVTASSIPASAASNYLSNCESDISGPSFCECTLNWFNAHVPQSQFVQDTAALEQYEQSLTSDPPQDFVEASAACTTNGG